ncbi:MAG: MBL fold metallo-hydrolase [Acidobacteria bacterium]|nr:MBL fold metallo-hydrolase [Acidobacteriota bacterium]
MNRTAATPRDAAAVILLNRDLSQVLWAQRNPQIPFLGGFHAFPGGKTDAADALVPVESCADPEFARFIACAARELFEEVGVLLARGGERLTKGQRAALHDDLISGRSGFAEILADWGLRLDARDFLYTGHWTTPKFSPVRFKTRFFIALCPPKQTPYAAITEMRNIEFLAPAAALDGWARGAVLISPPVLISLQELAKSRPANEAGETDVFAPVRAAAAALAARSAACDGNIDQMELNPHVICLPLRTDTLPPATHTNCFIASRREFVVIDAASTDQEELEKLFALVDSMIERGAVCRSIVVSHLHKDHTGGETLLKRHLREKFGIDVPLAAHRITAESLAGRVEFERFVEDGEIFELRDEAGEKFAFEALHTPGHARGHLCFYDEALGFLLTSDNVVGAGTVVIAPPEGDLTDYLASLERMKNLPRLRHLCGSHGAAVFDAKAKIAEYIAHRLERETQILEALRAGAADAAEIAAVVYPNLDPKVFPLAVKTVEAHLAKIEKEGLR